MEIKSKEELSLSIEISMEEEEYCSWLSSIGMYTYSASEITAEIEDIEEILKEQKMFIDIDRYSNISILVKKGE